MFLVLACPPTGVNQEEERGDKKRGIKYTLTINFEGEGSVNPASGSYAAGTVVILTPNPEGGSYFDSWEGPNAPDVVDNLNSTFSITMNENKSLTALFVVGVAYNLDLYITGAGAVDRDLYRYNYLPGTDVLLTPTADPGWFFDLWSGASSSDVEDNGDGTYTLTMDNNKSLEAMFHVNYILELYSNAMGTCSGTSSGDVELDPPGGSYAKDTTVDMTISLDNAYTIFEGWDGDSSADIIHVGDNNYYIVMDEDKSIEASFGLIMYTLEITINGNNLVQEVSICSFPFDSGTTNMDYVEGYTVILEPQPRGGATFDNWTGDNITDIGNGTYFIIMNADKALQANFSF